MENLGNDTPNEGVHSGSRDGQFSPHNKERTQTADTLTGLREDEQLRDSPPGFGRAWPRPGSSLDRSRTHTKGPETWSERRRGSGYKRKLPKFELGGNWETFAMAFEIIIEEDDLTMKQKVAELLSCLGENALTMFVGSYSSSTHMTWESVLTLCNGMWNREPPIDKATRELERMMTVKDNIIHFWSEKSRYAKVVSPLDWEKLARSKFYRGLPEKIRSAALSVRFSPVSEMLSICCSAANELDWKRDFLNAEKAAAVIAAEAEIEFEALYGSPKMGDSPFKRKRTTDSYNSPHKTISCFYCEDLHQVADCPRLRNVDMMESKVKELEKELSVFRRNI